MERSLAAIVLVGSVLSGCYFDENFTYVPTIDPVPEIEDTGGPGGVLGIDPDPDFGGGDGEFPDGTYSSFCEPTLLAEEGATTLPGCLSGEQTYRWNPIGIHVGIISTIDCTDETEHIHHAGISSRMHDDGNEVREARFNYGFSDPTVCEPEGAPDHYLQQRLRLDSASVRVDGEFTPAEDISGVWTFDLHFATAQEADNLDYGPVDLSAAFYCPINDPETCIGTVYRPEE